MQAPEQGGMQAPEQGGMQAPEQGGMQGLKPEQGCATMQQFKLNFCPPEASIYLNVLKKTTQMITNRCGQYILVATIKLGSESGISFFSFGQRVKGVLDHLTSDRTVVDIGTSLFHNDTEITLYDEFMVQEFSIEDFREILTPMLHTPIATYIDNDSEEVAQWVRATSASNRILNVLFKETAPAYQTFYSVGIFTHAVSKSGDKHISLNVFIRKRGGCNTYVKVQNISINR
jgi:hypothetical protein